MIITSRATLVSPGNLIATGLASPNGCLPNYISAAFNSYFTGTTTTSVVGCQNQAFDFAAINNPNLSYNLDF